MKKIKFISVLLTLSILLETISPVFAVDGFSMDFEQKNTTNVVITQDMLPNEAQQLLNNGEAFLHEKSEQETQAEKVAADEAGLKETFGFSQEEIDRGISLHGSFEQLQNELFGYQTSAAEYDINEDTQRRILTLISGGYTNGQAFAASVSLEILGIDTDTLIAAKIAEIEAAEIKEEDAEDTSAGFYALDEDSVEAESNDEVAALAVKMGLPYAIMEQYLLKQRFSNGDLQETLSLKMAQTFLPKEREEKEQAIFSNPQAETFSSESTTLSAENEYIPKRILSKPYTFATDGRTSINLNSGEFSYEETDLNIPGVAGLDLNIVRRYDAARSQYADPVSMIIPGKERTISFKVGYRPYLYFCSGCSHTDLTQCSKSLITNMNYYTLAYDDMYSEHGLVYDNPNYSIWFATEDYDYALAYKQSLPLSLYAATDRQYNDDVVICMEPFLSVVEPAFSESTYNFTSGRSETLARYGIAPGWALGFSSIEQYTGNDFYNKRRLVTADGRQYEVDFYASNGSGLAEYKLSDMKLENSGNGYPNAAYTLKHKDGKREYFNSNGDNIAIVDKYGNKITLEHTYMNGEISRITITDTLGNVVVYKNDNVDPTIKHYPPGKSGSSWAYHARWSLSLNGELIKEYYSRISTESYSPYHTFVFVKDANDEYTIYGGGTYLFNFNAFSPSATTNDSFFRVNKLYSIQYSNGLTLSIADNRSQRKLGYTGYEQHHMVSWKRYFNNLDDSAETLEEIYTYSDYTGLRNVVGWAGAMSGNTYNYSTKVVHQRLAEPIRFKWTEGETYYTFDESHRKSTVAEHKSPSIVQEEFATSIDSYKQHSKKPILYKKTAYSYNSNDLPASETETYYNTTGSAGRSVQKRYTYDNKGNVLTYTAPNNQTTTYTYDGTYNMPLTVEYKQNASTTISQKNTLSADKKSVIQNATYENNQEKTKTAFAYDTKGRPINEKTYIDATNYIEKQYDYGNSGQVVSQKTLGVKDNAGVLVAGSPGQPAGVVEEKYSYDSQGRLLSATDGNGNAETIQYTVNGRVDKVTHADGSSAAYSYDVVNNKVVYTNELGHKMEHTYDLVGNEISIKDITLNKLISQKAYDSFNRMYKQWFYNESGGVESENYYYYDAQGRIVEQGVRNAQGTVISKKGTQYQDWLGKKINTTYGDTSAPSVVSVEYYDTMDNVTKSGIANGSTEVLDQLAYDYVGNLVQKTTAYTKSKGGTFTEKFTYDYANRLLSQQTAIGTIRNTYDNAGRMVSQSDLEGNSTTFQYDALGRRVKDSVPFAKEGTNIVYSVKTYTYDNAGNLTQMDNAGLKTSHTNNNRNFLTETRSHNGNEAQTVSYTYNALGQPLTMTTGKGAVTQYSYDTRGNVVSMKDALNQNEQYVYDVLGRLKTKTDRNGQNTTYSYDTAGRSTNITTTGDAVSTGYAMSGATKQVQNTAESTTYTYDNFGRVLQEVTGNVKKQYAYDVGNNRTSMQIFVNNVKQTGVTYQYDAMSRLTQVSDGTATAVYAYDTKGNLASVSYNNGMKEEYTYNIAGQVTKVEHKRGSTVVNRYDYTYTPDGNQRSKTMLENGVDKGIVTYEYDGLGQLTQETKTLTGTMVQQYTYEYDKAGNRSKLTASGGESYTTTYAYDSNNRLLSETKQTGSGQTVQNYTYDANGNTKSVQGGGSNTTYQYNGFNRLVGLTENGTNIQYAYNAAGLRTKKTVGGVVTGFVWDEGKTVMETNGSGGVTAQYLQGFRTISQQTAQGRKYYGYNGHGDVVALSDPNGNVVKQYAYNAFGVEENIDAADTNPFRYCGEYYDVETGSIYLRARYYDPSVGRFLSEDTHWNTGNMIYGDNPVKMNEQKHTVPMESTSYTLVPDIMAVNQSANLYGYGMNNPIMYQDKDGEDATVAAEVFKWGWTAGGGTALLDGPLPFGDAAGVIIGGGATIIAGGIIIWDAVAGNKKGSNIKYAKKAPEPPSKLKNGDKVKTPDSHPNEFKKNKDGSYTHNKTGWNAKKDPSNHGGPHWDMKPPKGNGHINVGPKGNIF